MVLWEEECVLFREVSLFQGCPYRGVPLYYGDISSIVVDVPVVPVGPCKSTTCNGIFVLEV